MRIYRVKRKPSARVMAGFLGILFGLSFFAGCAGSSVKDGIGSTEVIPLQKAGAPDWVVKGSGAFSKESGKAFYGVGVSTYKDVVAQRSSADNYAREEIAKVMQVYIASLEKEYLDSIVGGEDIESAEKDFRRAVKTITVMTLSGVEIVDHWQQPVTGTLYSLAKLDLTAFKDVTEKMTRMNELSQRVKEYIKQNADREFEQLEKEETKIRD